MSLGSLMQNFGTLSETLKQCDLSYSSSPSHRVGFEGTPVDLQAPLKEGSWRQLVFCLDPHIVEGSLKGEGKLMALPQNFGRSVSSMTEGKRFLKLLQSQGALNESIVAELWERPALSFSFIFSGLGCWPARILACFFMMEHEG